MTITKEQAAIFKTALQTGLRKDLPIAEELETDTFYRMARFREHDLNSRGYEDLRFVIRQNGEENLYLDYYFIWDDGVSHNRINSDGTLTRLENMEGQWGWPEYEDEETTRRERERIVANNEMVYRVLQQKGLDGVDENEKPFYEMSTILIKADWFTETRRTATS
jgi:hypothetical protein